MKIQWGKKKNVCLIVDTLKTAGAKIHRLSTWVNFAKLVYY